jgi:CRP-like cAMP-binding protein
MLELGAKVEYAPGRVLIHEGDDSTHVCVLIHGCVKVTATNADGHVALLAIRMGGDIVGEVASLDNRPRSATVIAAGPVAVRVISRAEFLGLLTRYPDAAIAVGASVAAKLRWANERRVDFGGLEAKVRLARVLYELATVYGQRVGTGVVIGVAFSQSELASLVGVAEATVHRALAELRRHDVIKTGYRQTTVRDLTALRHLAGLAQKAR